MRGKGTIIISNYTDKHIAATSLKEAANFNETFPELIGEQNSSTKTDDWHI